MLPSEKVPVAVNCCVALVEIVGLAGVTVMDESVGGSSVAVLNTTSTQKLDALRPLLGNLLVEP